MMSGHFCILAVFFFIFHVFINDFADVIYVVMILINTGTFYSAISNMDENCKPPGS